MNTWLFGALFVFLCQYSLAQDLITDVFEEQECAILRTVIETRNFSTSRNGLPWTAVTIEPFFRLLCLQQKALRVSSPVTKIEKGNQFFLVHTLQGSLYVVASNVMAYSRDMEAFQSLLLRLHRPIYSLNKLDLDIFVRKDESEIDSEPVPAVDRNSRRQKWRRFARENDLHLIASPENLERLQAGEVITFDLPLNNKKNSATETATLAPGQE